MLKGIYVVMGLGLLANAAWMIASPGTWYARFPADVPDTGPLNPHFVRDVGMAFATCGAGLLWCAANLRRSYPVHLLVTLFLAGHALQHAVEIAGGHLPADRWLDDIIPAFLPGILMVVLALPSVRRRLGGPDADPSTSRR